MEQLTSHIAKAVNTAISSSWAIFVAASVALFLFFYGDLIGLDRQRVDLHFLVDAATFLMVFVIEHTQSREVAALHTKLDAVIRALDADTSTVGIEELFAERDPGDPRAPSAPYPGSASAKLGDFLRAREHVLDTSHQGVAVKWLRHHVVGAEVRERFFRPVRGRSQKEDRNVDTRWASPEQIENVDPVQPGHRDIQDQKIGKCRRDLIEDERSIRHVIDSDKKALLERLFDHRRRVRVVLG